MTPVLIVILTSTYTFLHLISVITLIYWKRPVESAIVMATGFTLLFSLGCLSFISVFAYVCLAILCCTGAARVYYDVVTSKRDENATPPFRYAFIVIWVLLSSTSLLYSFHHITSVIGSSRTMKLFGDASQNMQTMDMTSSLSSKSGIVSLSRTIWILLKQLSLFTIVKFLFWLHVNTPYFAFVVCSAYVSSVNPRWFLQLDHSCAHWLVDDLMMAQFYPDLSFICAFFPGFALIFTVPKIYDLYHVGLLLTPLSDILIA